MSVPVGIDDLNVFGGVAAVELADIAAARGLSDKELRAVQFVRRSVTLPFEDPVTLAVNAAKRVVDAAGPGCFELLIVATETGLDFGKPLSSYVHRHLGLSSRCRNLETKHACYGGTAALQLAAAWVRSSGDPNKRALVIMTDIARRHFNDPAELTAGSGAVAVSVSCEPRVLELDEASGYACKEVYDVARPTPTGEWGDPVLSLGAYLDLLEMAWENYQAAHESSLSLERHFRYMLYHTPLVSLVRQAHGILLEAGDDDVSPERASESFDRMVRPALSYARELANTYSGSLYTLLAGLIDSVPGVEAGTHVGLYSYGSGSAAELFGGTIRDGARATLAAHRIGERLAERRIVSVADYEALVRETDRCLTADHYQPIRDFIPGAYEERYRGHGLLLLEEITNHRRTYRWC